MKNISYGILKKEEINLLLFSNFDRYQEVTKCWRKENDKWVLKDISFTENWGPDEYESLVKCLQKTIMTGGTVFGAFSDNNLVGFASLENQFFGSKNDYLQLSSIHTSNSCRGRGIGKKLFNLVCKKAREAGAEKLYISAHSSEETISFYKALGCKEALEYNKNLVDKEPCDCQLEYVL